MNPSDDRALTIGTDARFHETRWTTVLAAMDPASPAVGDALGKLCRTYWYPLYAFARRSGLAPHDAADMTQAFFAVTLEKDRLKQVDRSKGKFRSFLLASLKNFLHNEWHKQRAQKRGGACEILSLDGAAAEQQYQNQPATQTSAEELYDQQWALALVREVSDQLRAEYERKGKADLFKELEIHLTGEVGDGQLQALSERLRMNPNTLKSALHRVRREFGLLLREKVRDTLAHPSEEDLREEIRHLFAAVAA